MILFGVITGLAIIALGFMTGSPSEPPTQALLFGGMMLIAMGYARVWRWHGIGAGVVVAFLATVSFFDALVAFARGIVGGNVPPVVLGQVIACIFTTAYFIIGGKRLIRYFKSLPAPSQSGTVAASQDDE